MVHRISLLRNRNPLKFQRRSLATVLLPNNQFYSRLTQFKLTRKCIKPLKKLFRFSRVPFLLGSAFLTPFQIKEKKFENIIQYEFPISPEIEETTSLLRHCSYFLLGTFIVFFLYIMTAISMLPTLVFIPIGYECYRMARLCANPFNFKVRERKMSTFHWLNRMVWFFSLGIVAPLTHSGVCLVNYILSLMPLSTSPFFRSVSDLHFRLLMISFNPFKYDFVHIDDEEEGDQETKSFGLETEQYFQELRSVKEENVALSSSLDKTKQKLENCQQKKVEKKDCV